MNYMRVGMRMGEPQRETRLPRSECSQDKGTKPQNFNCSLELQMSFPKATSVKGSTGRNNSQCTGVGHARQMKSSGEQTEQQQTPPSINRNVKEADTQAYGLDRPHVFFTLSQIVEVGETQRIETNMELHGTSLPEPIICVMLLLWRTGDKGQFNVQDKIRKGGTVSQPKTNNGSDSGGPVKDSFRKQNEELMRVSSRSGVMV
ncbi:hypothetical protein CB1_000310015 [Camelus ferus]|nr:hypothetical protein CB1_000310015 [Camelus ferus]